MIFLNQQRAVDENVNYKRNSFTGTAKRKSRLESNKMIMILMLFYLLASAFPVILFYPLSLTTLIAPCVMLSYAICIMNADVNHDVWPCCVVGIIGILIKLGGLIVYLSIFSLKQTDEKFTVRYKSHLDETAAKRLFFFILLALEMGILFLACCFKWHLVAYENNKQKKRTPKGTELI
ncbi:unnamed protein product, partial [Mesorhabditis belari]|uniref:NADH dehydrogenase subunit 6 n=1 Tax=Mesorhabditis belari TaxID=2138241 RepID=A0AAF3FRR5_9BILA